MKIILSRNRFDSFNGSIASPIFCDGTLCALPAPSLDAAAYDGLSVYPDGSTPLSTLLSSLHPAFSYRNCHVDPDLQMHYITPPEGWKPAFGQSGAAQNYLTNTVHIEPGDLFLFFGNFRMLSLTKGNRRKYRYSRESYPMGNTVPEGGIQLIWGYLQVDQILTDPKDIQAYSWHPHAGKIHLQDKNNALYIPRAKLSVNESYPGYGILNFSTERTLTLNGCKRAIWKDNPVYYPENIIGNRRICRKSNGIRYSGRWQELCLTESDAAAAWAAGIICGTRFTYEEKKALRKAAKAAEFCSPYSGWPFPKPHLFDVLTHIEEGNLSDNEISFLEIGTRSHRLVSRACFPADIVAQAQTDYDIVSAALDRLHN